MVKIGDKVRFLNAVGGGIVKAFEGKHKVIVEDDNGFDYPSLISECVVVETPDSPAARPKTAPAPPPHRPEPPKPAPRTVVTETAEGERIDCWLAYLPTDPVSMVDTAYEAYLINESNYFLYYTYLSRSNGSWTCRSHGMIEPNMKVFLEEFGKAVINDLERVCVQFIPFKTEKPFGLKSAYAVELRLDPVKFYKRHCFTENDFFDDDALIVPVVRRDVPEKPLLVSAIELQEAMMQKAHEPARTAPQPARKKRDTAAILEVDLHIHQLLDSTQGMTPTDMLNYQLDTFHRILKENEHNKGQQIVFIHGKGEGVLRAAIEKELKTRYKNYPYQDASFQEYGFGATLVKIR